MFVPENRPLQKEIIFQSPLIYPLEAMSVDIQKKTPKFNIFANEKWW